MPPTGPRSSDLRAAFEAEALPHMQALYGKAWRMTGNESDAADLVQETYLRAYRTFSNFKPGTNSKAWLFTIMYSIFVNRYRKRQRSPDTVSLDEAEEAFSRVVVAIDWEAEALIRENPNFGWQEAEVEQALKQLPEEFRAAVLLVDVEGFSYEEASEVLKCPVGTVRSRLSRARKHLFVALQSYAEKNGLLRKTAKIDGNPIQAH